MFPIIFVQVAFVGLIYVLLLPPILTMRHLRIMLYTLRFYLMLPDYRLGLLDTYGYKWESETS